ncbi:MAG: AAA family ATPase, partial [Lachnospiraceae bacterium]|nr:AAA family ATPase [Lachnospiraceae bacterium]
PRRFGKTLTMSMVERFFSVKYAGQGNVFENLAIWKEQGYRELQGTYPVISLSFASVKENNFEMVRKKINQLLTMIYEKNSFIKDSGILGDKELDYYNRVSKDMDDSDASLALYQMSDFLSRYYGKKVIILLDEYDTPMQEAYVGGYWDELVSYTRSLFNAAFKTNPYLERGIMTGITRVSKESIFSDLNNLKVVTTTSDEYADIFGFTEQEVFAAMDEFGYDEKEEVKLWYDGFTFGKIKDIYNPWSIINYLDTGRVGAYWANTSSNSLVGKLIREGSQDIKQSFEGLLQGGTLVAAIDEQIVYNQIGDDEDAIWSLLLASGYLKVLSVDDTEMRMGIGSVRYELTLTNREVRMMFESMIKGWFSGRSKGDYNRFIKALLSDDKKLMNIYMNKVALATISYFDSGNQPSGSEPERFYHGFVLGLLVDLRGRYTITSNRESGYGRYDIMLEPQNKDDAAIIMEFKVYDEEDEKTLQDTVASALAQIEEKNYAQSLIEKGIREEKIRKYGFAFQGKKVLIG